MAGERGGELPLDKYTRFKKNPQLWYDEMSRAGLTKEEQELLKPHLETSYGICEAQEKFMKIVQLPEVGGHSLLWADRLRKAVAKKSAKDYDQLEKEFFDTVEEQNLSRSLAQYVWHTLVATSRGYGFNASHTLAYSLIGLQELNLAYRFPIIYWNTGCLIVDSGGVEGEEEMDSFEEEIEERYDNSVVGFDLEDDDDDDDEEDDNIGAAGPKSAEKKKVKKVSYGKIASAIGQMQYLGVAVSPPSINNSTYTFSPDEKNGIIHYGLSGIARIGEGLVQSIMANRPYNSIEDFISKVKVNKTQMINLIKSGAFDEFGDRVEIMDNYIKAISDQKKTLNLRNMQMLINFNLIPEEYAFSVKVFNFNKYLKKFSSSDFYYLDDISLPFYEENYSLDDVEIENGRYRISQSKWKKHYDKEMDIMRTFIKENLPELLEKLNGILVDENRGKYTEGSLSKWEMDSLSYYNHAHELEFVDFEKYGISRYGDLPREPEVDRIITIKNKPVTLYKIRRIAGTVLDRDKNKKIVTLLTTDGVTTVKIYGGAFSHYDKQISEIDPQTGKKKVVEKSIFSRGNKIVVTGIRRGDNFIAKKYSRTPFSLVEKITKVDGPDIETERRSE